MAMHRAVWAVLALALAMAGHSPAAAATFVIMTDPMTLDRRMVVMDTPGRDRVLLCSMPPALAGCREVPMARRRR
jgi:hypothetical protein